MGNHMGVWKYIMNVDRLGNRFCGCSGGFILEEEEW